MDELTTVEKEMAMARSRLEVLKGVESREFRNIWDLVEQWIESTINKERSLIRDPQIAASTTGHAKCNGAIGSLLDMKSVPFNLLKVERENISRLIKKMEVLTSKKLIEDGNKEARDKEEE